MTEKNGANSPVTMVTRGLSPPSPDRGVSFRDQSSSEIEIIQKVESGQGETLAAKVTPDNCSLVCDSDARDAKAGGLQVQGLLELYRETLTQ